ncbi:MAG: hypothetical protein SCK29_10320 [Bacillota bacterium]|nr:hypothetical protein [Bacillota bacterium]MDW7684496.1 hypothetical protein [Bacillota bacterium]
MRVKINLSGSLQGIYTDKTSDLFVDINIPVTVRHVLAAAGVNPLVVAAVLVDGEMKSKDFTIEEKINEITLVGPIAGG